VSLFFTISGFLITSLLLNEHAAHGRVRLRSFWERRCRRLMPAALVTLIAIAIAVPHFASPAQRVYARGDLLGALGYVANWRFLATGHSYAATFAGPSPVQHFWSLAIEEQFYLLFPIVVVLALRRGSRRVLGAVLALMLVASVLAQVAIHDV